MAELADRKASVGNPVQLAETARARGQVLPSRSHARPVEQRREIPHRPGDRLNERGGVQRLLSEQGLYPEQVEAWREACLGANADAAEQEKQQRKARKAEQKKLHSWSASCAARTRRWPRQQRC